MKKILFTVVFILFLGSQIVYAQSTFLEQNKEYIDKLIFAVVGAILGFLSNYLLSKRKEKREAKELSYELNIKEVITKDETPIKDNIGISYKDRIVKNLSFITCNVKNTSEVVVKDEVLRFEFPEGIEILDGYIEPKPEPELKITDEVTVPERMMFEKKYKIGHLVKDKEVNFNFVVGASNPELKIHDFNENGDVKFNEASVNVAKNEEDILRQFFYTNFILILLYPLMASRWISLFGIDILWSLAFLGFNLSFIKPIGKFLAQYLSDLKQQKLKDLIQVSGNNNIAIQSLTSSDVSIRTPKPTNDSLA